MSDEMKQLILEDYGVETFDEIVEEVKNDYVLSFVGTLEDAQDNYFSLAEQMQKDENTIHEEGDTLLIHVNEDVVLKGSDDYYFVKTGNSTIDENAKTVEEYLKVYGSYYEDCFDDVGKITISNDIPFDSNTVYYKKDSFVNTSVQNVYGFTYRDTIYNKYLLNYEKLLNNVGYSDLKESGITIYDAADDIESRNSDNWKYTENYDYEKKLMLFI